MNQSFIMAAWRRELLLAGVLSLACVSAAAQTTTNEAGVFVLGTTTVYGQAELPADALPETADTEKLRRFERVDLAGSLNLFSGVTLANTGARNEANLFVRGYDLRQAPVFLDGIPQYVPYDGYVDLHRFTTYDTASISVSKGFSSVLYGPNALGGAINVVSRRPENEFEVDSGAGYFSGNGRDAFANIGSRLDNWYVQAGGSWLKQDYYRLSDEFTPRPTENGGRRENSYREDWKGSVKVGYTPNETDEYAIGFQHQEGEKGNPPYAGGDPTIRPRFWQWPQWDKQSVYFVSQTALGDSSYVKPRVYYDTFDNTLSAYDNANYNSQAMGSSFTSIYDDHTWGGSLELGTEIIPNNTLKGAAHYKFDHHDEHNIGQAHSVFEDETIGFGIEDTLHLTDDFALVMGVGYDHRKVLETRDTNTGTPLGGDSFDSMNPQLGLFYDLPKAGTIHATWARKSRFPTIKDRYSYRLGQAIPNPNLDLERADHYELGYRSVTYNGFSANATVFFSELEDAIQRVDNVATSPSGGALFQLQNVGRAENFGTEVGVDYDWEQTLLAGASYTYLSRENKTNPAIYFTDTPEHKILSYVEGRPVRWLSLIPIIEYNGERYAYSDGREIGGFVVVDFKVSVRLPKGFTLNTGVNNILDKNYQLAEGYPEAGRNYFVNLRFAY